MLDKAKQDYQEQIVGWTKCAICSRYSPAILALWDEPQNYLPTCLNCLDEDKHEGEIMALIERNQEEEADNYHKDILPAGI